MKHLAIFLASATAAFAVVWLVLIPRTEINLYQGQIDRIESDLNKARSEIKKYSADTNHRLDRQIERADDDHKRIENIMRELADKMFLVELRGRK